MVAAYDVAMASIFTKIINGDIPSRMVCEDEECVAFLDVRPLATGHVLVVPRQETDQWTDLGPAQAAHLTEVAHAIGRAQMVAFSPARIGLLIAGFEVPHAHMHVVPINNMSNLDFAMANSNPDQAELDSQLASLRSELSQAGHSSVSSR